MAQTRDEAYTERFEARKRAFTDQYMVTKPVDPERRLEHWPKSAEKRTYLSIFALPMRQSIINNDMHLTMTVVSSFDEYRSDRLDYESFERATFPVTAALNILERPDEITLEAEERYKKNTTRGFAIFSLTDRGYERGRIFGDCFDLNFYDNHSSGYVSHGMFGDGALAQVPDMVTREFLVDVARYVQVEARVKKETSSEEEYVNFHNTYIRRAVLQELVRAFVRKFRYVDRYTGLEGLSEWAREQPTRSSKEVELEAERSAFGLLRKSPWWFLWALFVGYASVIRFPENRETMRGRLPKLDPPVWPLPAEGELSGAHKAVDPVEPTTTPSPPSPQPAPVSAPLGARDKVYRENRKRAKF